MIILQETSGTQELNIIARDSDVNLLTFTDEQTHTRTSVISSFLDAGYYLTADIVLDFLKEDHTYRLRAYNTNDTLTINEIIAGDTTVELPTDAKIRFNSLVFVTNQDIIDNVGVYDVNEEEYKSNETENEYIILD